MRSSAVAAIALLVASCAARQDPDADATQKRIAALEQQVTAQQRQLDDLARVVKASPETTALLERVVELQGDVDRIKAERQAPPSPPPRREPDPAAVYAVPIAGSPVSGPSNAKVTMVMAGEFGCPFCRRAWDTVDQLRKKYGNDLRVVYRSFVVHAKIATYPAQAACAANRQGKWRKLADLLWTKAFDTRQFEKSHIDDLAKEAGLDMKRYRADVAGICPAEVDHDQAELLALGVDATPSFFINGRYLAGAQPIEDFSALIDEEMAKAKTAIAGGVPADRYYQQEILDKGLKQLAAP